MDRLRKSEKVKLVAASTQYSLSPVIKKSLMATLVLAGILGATVFTSSGSTFWFLHQSGDYIDNTQKRAREANFIALKPLSMSTIPGEEIGVAVDGMQLSPEARQSLVSDLSKSTQSSSSRLSQDSSPSSAASRSAVGQSVMQPTSSSPDVRGKSHASMVRKPSGLRLAWVTLWDTDAEDGDVVRIDSQGYSRTITLTKQPVTFAIPVPASGVVNVTGIRDGEGGGITVGLASGESKAIFPIMSVGQTLGLKVEVN